MRQILGLSLGSSRRDWETQVVLEGEEYLIKRLGVDGSLAKARRVLEEHDGKVDAFGLGGTDLFLAVGDKRYHFHQSLKLVRGLKTPVVDGNGLKNTIERNLMEFLPANLVNELRGCGAVVLSGCDRYGLALGLEQMGMRSVFGDFVVSFGLPIIIGSRRTLDRWARIVLPVVTRLPIQVVYPVNVDERAPRQSKKLAEYIKDATVVAGDSYYLRGNLPERLDGKVIISNSLTPSDRQAIFDRGARCIISTTPSFQGRSYGTNVMEALIVAFLRMDPSQISPELYMESARRLQILPGIEEAA